MKAKYYFTRVHETMIISRDLMLSDSIDLGEMTIAQVQKYCISNGYSLNRETGRYSKIDPNYVNMRFTGDVIPHRAPQSPKPNGMYISRLGKDLFGRTVYFQQRVY